MSERGMSEQETQFLLGQLLGDGFQRDAIHIAVAPVVSTQRLAPGQDVGFVAGSTTEVCLSARPIGIVDPFLKGAVFPGDRFWLFLYPNTITSLRHQWTHPAFEPGTITKDDHIAKSKLWIAEHAEHLGLSADVLMSDAANWIDSSGGEYKVQDGSQRWRDEFDPMKFWHHYEIVTGKTVRDDLKNTPYCCTC